MNPFTKLFEAMLSAIENQKRKEIEYALIQIFSRIGIDKPSNFQEISDFVYNDVSQTADSENWSDGDVAIAFRRWIEEQALKGYRVSAE